MDLYHSKPVKAADETVHNQEVIIPVLALNKSNPKMILINTQFRLLRIVQISLI